MARRTLSAVLASPSMSESSVVAESLDTLVIARFRGGNQQSALEAQLRTEHRTGSLTIHYTQGSVGMIEWTEKHRA